MAENKSEHIVSILEFFKNLADPRSTFNRPHFLRDLIVSGVVTVVAAADGPKGIGV